MRLPNAFKPALLAFAAATAFGAQAADIKIGVAAALSGGAAQYGAAIRNGFQLAADEINAAGGINGDKIVLAVEDEQGKKEDAINVFKKLIFQDKVLMTFGPTLSNSAQAATRSPRRPRRWPSARRTRPTASPRSATTCSATR